MKLHVDTDAVLDRIEMGPSVTLHARLNVFDPAYQHAIAEFAEGINFANETMKSICLKMMI